MNMESKREDVQGNTAGATPVTSPGAADPPASTGDPQADQELVGKVIGVLRTCFDPEIPVDIYELGLVYSVEVKPEGAVGIRMTLTSPACPVAGSLPPEVEAKVRAIPGVAGASVEVVWDPPWNPSMMSEAAKLQLNMM